MRTVVTIATALCLAGWVSALALGLTTSGYESLAWLAWSGVAGVLFFDALEECGRAWARPGRKGGGRA